MRLVLVTMLCVLAGGAVAQNAVSQKLRAIPEANRNAAFRSLITDAKDQCDRVVRTQFNGSAGQVDDWEARCADGNQYSFSIPSDLTTIVKYMSCKELLLYSTMLARRAGDNSPQTGCQMK